MNLPSPASRADSGPGYPRYFRIAGQRVNSFTVFLCVGTYIGILVIAALAQSSGMPPLRVGLGALALTIIGLAGARVYHLLVYHPLYFGRNACQSVWDSKRWWLERLRRAPRNGAARKLCAGRLGLVWTGPFFPGTAARSPGSHRRPGAHQSMRRRRTRLGRRRRFAGEGSHGESRPPTVAEDRLSSLSGPTGFPTVGAQARDARRGPTSHDAFPTDGTAIHLEFELLHRRPRIVPGQPGTRRAAAHDLVGEKRIEVAHGVDLRRRGVGPAKTEYRKAPLHLAHDVARLLAHGLGTGFAAPDGAFAVAAASLPRLGASRDHEARGGIGVGGGERESTAPAADRCRDTHCCARPD